MPTAQCLLAMALLSATLAGSAFAQNPAPAVAAEPGKAQRTAQDVEPAVDTSAIPADPGRSHPQEAAAAAPAKPGAPSANAAPRSAPGGEGRPKANAKDRIELDTTQITGNRELPKVLYIVPWKHSDLSDLAGRPANSLLDEVLTPVDRDVFQRENRYYGALQPDAPRAAERASGAPAAPQALPQAPAVPPARVEK